MIMGFSLQVVLEAQLLCWTVQILGHLLFEVLVNYLHLKFLFFAARQLLIRNTWPIILCLAEKSFSSLWQPCGDLTDSSILRFTRGNYRNSVIFCNYVAWKQLTQVHKSRFWKIYVDMNHILVFMLVSK